MELSWSTFVLEIVNFLVLVWILKHFLYRPVLDIIARRRKAVEDKLAEARDALEQAQTLKEKYSGRLAAWESEKRSAADKLKAEIEAERAQRLENLGNELAKERKRAQAATERRQIEIEREAQGRALHQAAAFANRLLETATGPELEARLLDLVLEGLKTLPPEQIERLRERTGSAAAAIEVSSAFDVSAEQRARLDEALRAATGISVPVRYSRDSDLIAGYRIVIGAWVLAANVRDELQGFAELAHAPV